MKQMVQWKSSNLLLTMSWRGLIWHKGARFIFIFCNPLDLSSKIKVILVLCMFIIIWKNTLKNRFPSRGFWPLMLPEVRRFLRMVHGCLGSSSLYLPLDSLGSSSAWSRFVFHFVRQCWRARLRFSNNVKRLNNNIYRYNNTPTTRWSGWRKRGELKKSKEKAFQVWNKFLLHQSYLLVCHSHMKISLSKYMMRKYNVHRNWKQTISPIRNTCYHTF